MALWRISVKRSESVNGVRLEKGMFVEMVTPVSMSDPLRSNVTENKPKNFHFLSSALPQFNTL